MNNVIVINANVLLLLGITDAADLFVGAVGTLAACIGAGMVFSSRTKTERNNHERWNADAEPNR
jgi:hypothetical protein